MVTGNSITLLNPQGNNEISVKQENKISVKHEIASVTLPAAVFYYLCKRVAQFVLPTRPISYAI